MESDSDDACLFVPVTKSPKATARPVAEPVEKGQEETQDNSATIVCTIHESSDSEQEEGVKEIPQETPKLPAQEQVRGNTPRGPTRPRGKQPRKRQQPEKSATKEEQKQEEEEEAKHEDQKRNKLDNNSSDSDSSQDESEVASGSQQAGETIYGSANGVNTNGKIVSVRKSRRVSKPVQRNGPPAQPRHERIKEIWEYLLKLLASHTERLDEDTERTRKLLHDHILKIALDMHYTFASSVRTCSAYAIIRKALMYISIPSLKQYPENLLGFMEKMREQHPDNFN